MYHIIMDKDDLILMNISLLIEFENEENSY